MANELGRDIALPASLQSRYVWLAATASLFLGLVIGYAFPGSQPHTVQNSDIAAVPAYSGTVPGHMQMPDPEEMRQMADSQAAPLLQQLKSAPENVDLLIQVGAVYHVSHQYKEAAEWYGKALQIQPRNVPVRTKLATSLYRNGDVDGAIAQLNQALRYDPKDANSLFNLGMIRLQGKGDARGALAAWQKLLQSNPQLSADRKAAVLQLIAGVMTTLNDQHALEGARTHEESRPKSE